MNQPCKAEKSSNSPSGLSVHNANSPLICPQSWQQAPPWSSCITQFNHQKFPLASSQASTDISFIVKFLYPLILGFAPFVFAQETPPAEMKPAPAEAPAEKAPAKSPIKQINENEYLIGKVHLDKKARAISFPAAINMDDGLLEYAIVHFNGKIHESLLLTDIKASNLNIAFKLLRYPESDELFEILEDDYKATGKYPTPTQATRDGARINITLNWELDGKKKSAPINELIYHTTLERPMPTGPWLYTGSYVLDGSYKADLSGDITAIFLAQPSMINYPGKDRISDEVWIVNKKACPPVGTPITVTITPYETTPAEKKAPIENKGK